VKIYNVDATARTLKGPAGSGFSLAVPAKGTTSFTFKGTTRAPSPTRATAAQPAQW